MSAKGALSPTSKKFCLEYVLCKTKQAEQSAIFQQHQKFCKTLRLFLYNLRLLKALRLSAERQNPAQNLHYASTFAQMHAFAITYWGKRFVNSFFRYVTTFLLLCIAFYVQKQNQKICAFIPSHAKNAVVTFIGSFAKGRQKNAVAL